MSPASAASTRRDSSSQQRQFRADQARARAGVTALPHDPHLPRAGVDIAQPLADSLLGRLPALTEHLVDTILQEQSRDTVEPMTREDLSRSGHDNLQRILQVLGGSLPQGVDPYEVPRATAIRRAEQGVPLDVVLRAFRIGGKVVWQGLVDEAGVSHTVDSRSLLDVATRVWEVIDDFSSEVVAAYRATEGELVRRAEQRVNALIDALLTGCGNDRAVATDAARMLGLPTVGGYAVVVADAHGPAGAALHRPHQLLAQHGIRSVWTLRYDYEIGIVALSKRPVEVVAQALRPHLCGRAGVSPAADNLTDLGDAYQHAITAVTTLPTPAVEIVTLDARLPEALVVSAPVLSERLVRTVLGPILALDLADREPLLLTLRTWLDSKGSTAETAVRLYCHRNTVHNRLRRIEAITGHSLDQRAGWLSYALALTALELLPSDRGGVVA